MNKTKQKAVFICNRAWKCAVIAVIIVVAIALEDKLILRKEIEVYKSKVKAELIN